MKIKWLVADVTAVGTPLYIGTCYFGDDFGWALFWPIQAVFVVGEPFCDVGTASRALIRLMERAILEVILAWRCFGQFRPYLWSRSHFVT